MNLPIVNPEFGSSSSTHSLLILASYITAKQSEKWEVQIKSKNVLNLRVHTMYMAHSRCLQQVN